MKFGCCVLDFEVGVDFGKLRGERGFFLWGRNSVSMVGGGELFFFFLF